MAVLDIGQGVAPILVNQVQALDLGVNFRELDRIAGSIGIGSGPAPVIYRTQSLTLRLDSIALGDMEAGVSNALEPISRTIGQPIAANIGYQFLNNYTLKLNYSISTMSLSRQALPKGQPFVIGPRKPLAIVEGRISSANAYMTSVQALEVAFRHFSDISFAAGNFFDRLTQAVGSNVDGVLGAIAFQNLVLTIDYPNQRLSITNL